jgi:hypothetical protein
VAVGGLSRSAALLGHCDACWHVLQTLPVRPDHILLAAAWVSAKTRAVQLSAALAHSTLTHGSKFAAATAAAAAHTLAVVLQCLPVHHRSTATQSQ